VIAVEQLQRMDRATTRRVGKSDGRRIGPSPRPVVAGDRPKVTLLDAAAAGIEHRRGRLVDRDLARGQDELAHAKIERLELSGGIPDPKRQDRSLDVDALAHQHLGLPVERQMPRILGDQYRGHHGFSRQPALDQSFRRRRLDNRLVAGAAGIFGTVRHDRPVLRRDHIEPLRSLFADHMHRRPAARTGFVLGLDRYMNLRQMGRKRAAFGPAFIGSNPGRLLVLPVGDSFAGRDCLLDVLKRQSELVRVELLGTGTKVHAPQLLQEMLKPVILRPHFVPLCDGGIPVRDRSIPLRDGGVALGGHHRKPRLQHLDFDGKLIRTHAEKGIRFARDGDKKIGIPVRFVAGFTMPLPVPVCPGREGATSRARRQARRPATLKAA